MMLEPLFPGWRWNAHGFAELPLAEDMRVEVRKLADQRFCFAASLFVGERRLEHLQCEHLTYFEAAMNCTDRLRRIMSARVPGSRRGDPLAASALLQLEQAIERMDAYVRDTWGARLPASTHDGPLPAAMTISPVIVELRGQHYPAHVVREHMDTNRVYQAEIRLEIHPKGRPT